MTRFIIVDGLPFLYANGKAYSVRWDEKGFTVGSEVELASEPSVTYSELSIKAKCAGHLDSISASMPENQETDADEEKEPENQETDADEETEIKPDFEEMKVDDLKKYASDNGIALKGARTKPEIIEAINNASNE